MADFKRASVIDGLSSVRAASRSGKNTKTPRLRASRTTLPILDQDGNKKEKEQPQSAGKARIGHTAVPPRHEITCYECTYFFVVTGRLDRVICPKCHKSLCTRDYVIDKAQVLNVKTVGAVKIEVNGEVTKGSHISAREIVIAGKAENGKIDCAGTIKLSGNCRLDVQNISFRDISVLEDCRVSLTRKLNCRNMEVSGQIRARITATGIVTVRRGGFLLGEVTTQGLEVEDGGGLNAKIRSGIFEAGNGPEKNN